MAQQSPQHGAPAASAAPAGDNRSKVLRWAAGAALVGTFLIYNSIDSTDTAVSASAPASAAAVPGASAAAAPPAKSSAAGLPPSRPTLLTIPVLGVSAPFTPLSIGASGKLDAPPSDDNNLAGWYAAGPTPGERGNAIVAGHVDTKTGPAVFFLLDMLKPGATADITRADGVVATFKVDSVETFSKGAFPDQRVYGDTPDAQLRIITCGGAYDHHKKDYTDNVVVFAHLLSSHKA